MTFKDHFSRLAAQYAAYRPHYPGALFDFLARTVSGRKRAWDCACGSGQATLALAERFDSVVGTDASAHQIAAAKPHPRVTYAAAPAEASGLESASVDLVTVAQSLHWFDVPKFYAEARRVLHATGVLAVWTYGCPRLNDPALDRIVRKFHWETVGPYWPPERRHVDDGYRSLTFPFAEVASPSLAMQESWTQEQFLGYLRSWSAVARYVDKHGEDPVTPLGEELAPAWGGGMQRVRTVSWPLSLRVGRA